LSSTESPAAIVGRELSLRAPGCFRARRHARKYSSKVDRIIGHPERTREGSGIESRSQILREYPQDDDSPCSVGRSRISSSDTISNAKSDPTLPSNLCRG
jgi:hypothetical protein